MHFGGKRLFLLGFVVLLLVGIPVSVYLLQRQQEIRSRAEKATNLTFNPVSSSASPISKSVGDSIPLDVMVDPGTNLVSFVKLEIQYDPDKIATASSNAFQVNSAVFPSVLEGPIYTPGKIAVTLSVGPDPTKAIQSQVKAATFTFKALTNTAAGTPTLITYTANAQALSIGSNDQASENVLASTTPATIVIGGASATSPTPTTIASSGTPVPTDTLVPTETPSASATPVPTDTPAASVTPVPTIDNGTGTPNVSPVCSSLAVDRSTTGTAPLSLTFTANGTDSDGTVSKATFNFGDGEVSDVTSSGGIGTNTVSAQISHTYNTPGTYQASALLTDSNNGISDSTNCKQTITVNAAGVTGAVSTATPTLAATGSTGAFAGISAAAIIFIIGGGLLFFIL